MPTRPLARLRRRAAPPPPQPDPPAAADLLDPAPSPESIAARLDEAQRSLILAWSVTHFRAIPPGRRTAAARLATMGLAHVDGADMALSDAGIAVRRVLSRGAGRRDG